MCLLVAAVLSTAAGCESDTDRTHRDAQSPNTRPTAATAPARTPEDDSADFDATDAPQAVRRHILLTRGRKRLEQVVGTWWSGPPDGGKVTIRFRNEDGSKEDVDYWAMRSRKGGDYEVFDQFPTHLDHPSVHSTLAREFVHRLGYHSVSWGCQWSLGDEFATGADAVTIVHYVEHAPDRSSETASSIPKSTHVAYCTLRKTAQGWALFRVTLKSATTEKDFSVTETLLRTLEEEEIRRVVEAASSEESGAKTP